MAEKTTARDLDGGLLSLDEYNALSPEAQGWACYMQAAWPGSPIPDENPYPKGSANAEAWSRGAFKAAMETQESAES